MSHAPIVLIMGPPGAGKGTQATHLVEVYSLKHVATGDLLRAAVAQGTPLGLEAKSYMDVGGLVPDDVIIGMIRELVDVLPADKGILLDGFPRTQPQAVSLDETLGSLERSVDLVLDIRVPEDVLVERLSGRFICRDCQRPYNVTSKPPAVAGVCDHCGGELYQRADDTSDAVRNRLQVYANDTEPVSSFYADRGVLVTIDGNRSPADVQATIDESVATVAAR